VAPARVVIVFVLVLLVGSTSPASASDARGTTTIDLGGGALRVLHAQGATLAARSPARIVRGELRLPVREGLVASTATINLGGSLTLRRFPADPGNPLASARPSENELRGRRSPARARHRSSKVRLGLRRSRCGRRAGAQVETAPSRLLREP
jgi:hypothetical protein